jgi:uncharacterized membrane protein YbhN (UPF0104 family)
MGTARRAARFLVSAGVLFLLTRVVDFGLVLDRLRTLSPGWVALGLALSLAQALILAWRWRFTAGRLTLELPLGIALTEYYLGNFLNQVLPGGVVGDASRAWRHARHEPAPGPAVRAVVLERASAQMVMTSVAIVSVALLPGVSGVVRASVAGLGLAGLTALTVLVLRTSSDSPTGRLARDARRAVFSRGALPFQAVTAAAVVASYISMYLIAAAAVGVDTPAPTLAPLVAPVLMTMLLPVSVAGWGIREAAAAALWGGVGLTPEDGVAISVAYGAMVLLSTTPGAVVLIAPGAIRRDRRERRSPDETSEPEAAARR